MNNKDMPRMLLLPNGSAVNPAMIHVVKGVEGKGVIIRNEYNKMIEFIKFIANEHHPLIVAEVQKVQSQGEDWVQPDWDALLGKASAPATAKTTKSTT